MEEAFNSVLPILGGSKEFMLPMMAAMARKGYLTASIDCRYHGKRALVNMQPYRGYQLMLRKYVIHS